MRELRILLLPFWLVGVTLRNQLWLKPRAYYARRLVSGYLRRNGLPFKSIPLWIGLAKADVLSCVVFTWNDADLAKLNEADCLPILMQAFHDGLSRAKYPAWAITKTKVSIHSEQTIARSGGFYRYFNETPVL